MHQSHRLAIRTWGVLLSLFLSPLLPSGAWAASHTSAHAYLISIGRLYESLEYERALDQIRLARQGPRSTEEEVTLSLYEGIILMEFGQQEQGYAAFKSALLLQSEAKLPVRVAPKIETLFESVRQKVKHELAAVHAKRKNKAIQAEAVPQLQTRPTPSPTPAPITVASRVSQERNLRQYSLPSAITGGTLLVAGGISWAISRTQLNRLRNDDPSLTTQEDVQRTISHGRTWQTAGITMLGVGMAGLAAAAGLYAASAPSMPVTLGVSTDGTSALVYGRWP